MPYFEGPHSLAILMAADDRLHFISHPGKWASTAYAATKTCYINSCSAACLEGGRDGWCFYIHGNGNTAVCPIL